jgi:hypothetical protein
MAVLTLFRIATGDNWNGIMKDTLREDCDDSASCMNNCCVSPILAPMFFVVFVLISQFVLVNVVVAVLMKHLEESNKKDAEPIKDNGGGTTAWATSDTEGGGTRPSDTDTAAPPNEHIKMINTNHHMLPPVVSGDDSGEQPAPPKLMQRHSTRARRVRTIERRRQLSNEDNSNSDNDDVKQRSTPTKTATVGVGTGERAPLRAVQIAGHSSDDDDDNDRSVHGVRRQRSDKRDRSRREPRNV